jgi:hypothetical protein
MATRPARSWNPLGIRHGFVNTLGMADHSRASEPGSPIALPESAPSASCWARMTSGTDTPWAPTTTETARPFEAGTSFHRRTACVMGNAVSASSGACQVHKSRQRNQAPRRGLGRVRRRVPGILFRREKVPGHRTGRAMGQSSSVWRRQNRKQAAEGLAITGTGNRYTPNADHNKREPFSPSPRCRGWIWR